MNWKALILSNVFVICLLFALVVTRVIRYMPDAIVDIQEIELSMYEPPAEQDLEEISEPELLDDTPPPPPPSFQDLVITSDPKVLALPNPAIDVQIDTQTDLFSSERAPAPLIVKESSPKPRVVSKPTIGKMSVSIGLKDLDAKPSLISRATIRWPRSVRASSVNAVLHVELSQSGSVRLIKIVSLDDDRLKASIASYVSRSKFTVPKRNGKPVKVKFNWPITFSK